MIEALQGQLPFLAIAMFYGYGSIVLDRRVLTPERATLKTGRRGGVFHALRELQPILYLGSSWLLAIPFPDPLGREWSLLFSLSYYTVAAGAGLVGWALVSAIALQRYKARLTLPGDTLRPRDETRNLDK